MMGWLDTVSLAREVGQRCHAAADGSRGCIGWLNPTLHKKGFRCPPSQAEDGRLEFTRKAVVTI